MFGTSTTRIPASGPPSVTAEQRTRAFSCHQVTDSVTWFRQNPYGLAATLER
jgi:hypothetical protein